MFVWRFIRAESGQQDTNLSCTCGQFKKYTKLRCSAGFHYGALQNTVEQYSGHGPVVDPSDTMAMMGGGEGEGGAKTSPLMIYMCICILCVHEMCLEIIRDNMTRR